MYAVLNTAILALKCRRGASTPSLTLDFDIADFLFEYVTLFHALPSRKASNAALDDYAENWHEISNSYRELRRWTCEGCGVDLSEHPSLLHCHHVNGVRSDNTKSNLRALCMICHAEQPSHGHMKVPSDQRRQIERLRFEQSKLVKAT